MKLQNKEHFDYQIRPESPQSKVIVKLKNELRKLGDEMVNVAAANGISLSTDDVQILKKQNYNLLKKLLS